MTSPYDMALHWLRWGMESQEREFEAIRTRATSILTAAGVVLAVPGIAQARRHFALQLASVGAFAVVSIAAVLLLAPLWRATFAPTGLGQHLERARWESEHGNVDTMAAETPERWSGFLQEAVDLNRAVLRRMRCLYSVACLAVAVELALVVLRMR